MNKDSSSLKSKKSSKHSERITFVVSSLRGGGMERVVSVMANYWARQGRQVTIITLNHGDKPVSYELHPNVQHLRLIRTQKTLRIEIFYQWLFQHIIAVSPRWPKRLLPYAWIIFNAPGKNYLKVKKSLQRIVAKIDEYLTAAIYSDSNRLFYRVLSKIAEFVPNKFYIERALIRDIKKTLQSTQPQAIIAFGTTTNIRVIRAAHAWTIPVVVSERTSPLRPLPGIKLISLVRKCFYPRASCVVVQTREAGNFFSSQLGSKVKVITNPVLSRKNQGQTSDNPFPKRNFKKLVAMGRLDHVKGFDMLIGAFALVSESHPSWSLEIWGEGPLRTHLEAIVDQLGLTRCVRLPGFSTEPAVVFSRADIFVMSSRYEGFPNALCEAMACGLPAVSFDFPSSAREIIRNRVDGIIVPREDISALAEAIDILMADDEFRHRLAQRAPEVAERFSINNVMNKWEQLLFQNE